MSTKIDTTNVIEITCDECGKQEINPNLTSWYSIEWLGDTGFRMVETWKKKRAYEWTHLTNRRKIDLCGVKCARLFFYSDINEFLGECKPPADRKSSILAV